MQLFNLVSLTLGFLSMTGVSAAPRPRQLADVHYSCTKPNTAAITIDDGPFQYNDKFLNLFAEKNVSATFFFVGNLHECIYDDEQIQRIRNTYERGHEIGSHTWSHEDLSQMDWDRIHDEMWRVEQALQRIIGVQPAMMRPPFGNFNDQVREAAAIRGQSLAIWDFDSRDSLDAPFWESIDLYAKAIYDQHPPTLLALNHEDYWDTFDKVLPWAIDNLRQQGYEIVPLSECLGIPPYQWQSDYQTKDDSWQC